MNELNNDEREITTHHDGHGLNEKLRIVAGPAGPGGASHEYKVSTDEGGGYMRSIAYVQFQLGPRGVEGSTTGCTTAALIAILLDHLEGFQAGDYRCRENALAITKLEEAVHWIKHRADARAKRGVLGTLEK